jgi:acid phosphatase type 7
MLHPGQVRGRPRKGYSQAFSGVQPISALTHSTQAFQPLPQPLGQPPYHYDLESVLPGIGAEAATKGKIVFHCVGDTGGIKHPLFQTNVADAMKADLSLPASKVPSFFYHLGDVVYFNGQSSEYYGQFYEPYDAYTPPIIAIPGNHDGDPIDSTQVSLDGWVAYFMTAQPHVDPPSHDAPRVTMSQPNVFFTLLCPFVTIVGMYTNVPEHGSVDSVQQQWLTNELATADPNKALIVALHHPVYSFDNFHSGSPNMANVLDQAINDSRRVPNMVLTAHVHNYQRIEQTVAGKITIPFIVSGNGGYYNLHKLNAAPGDTDPDNNAKLAAADDKSHGYTTLTVDAKNISGEVTSVNNKTGHASRLEAFAYPAAARTLPAGATVNL